MKLLGRGRGGGALSSSKKKWMKAMKFPAQPEFTSQQALIYYYKRAFTHTNNMDSFYRFLETQLPPIEKFHSSLTDERTSHIDYQDAPKVWKTFSCETLGDYHDLYLKIDVTLLADVFQTFRRTCKNAYKLDSLHYYTAPGLPWDALFKYTGIELEFLTDSDQHLLIEKGMRGSISMTSKRHAKANNPGVPGYNPNEQHNHIMYYDANNLYGSAMSQPFPYSGFKWLINSRIN